MADQETGAENDKKVSEEKDIKEETVGKGQKRKKAATPAKTAAKKKRKVDDTEAIKEDAAEDSAEAESTEDEKMEDGGVVPLLDQPIEMTGTRVRKQVQRLNITTVSGLDSPDRRKAENLPGRGMKLGNSPRILAQWQNIKQSELTLLHRLLFKRPGTAHEIKKNIKEFSGFPFTKEDKEFESRKHLLEKNTLTDLKFICQVLCLEKSGTKEMIVERILEFCLCPDPVTLPVKEKGKKSKTKSKKTGTKKEKKGESALDDSKSSRKSPKKSVKSDEIVDDDSSSSSESEEESQDNESQSDAHQSTEEEPSPPKKGKKTPSKKTAQDEEEPSPPKKGKTPSKKIAQDEEEEESPAKEKKEVKEAGGKKGKVAPAKAKKEKSTPTKVEKSKKETPAKKAKEASSPASKAKKSPKKAPKMEIKIKLPPLKSKKDRAPVVESDGSGDEEEKDKEAEESPAAVETKETGKNKKGDRTSDPVSDSSDKKLPTDEELVTTIKNILKDANLENLTMKNLYRKVYDTYPGFDLEKTKKDFIRTTAKEILGAD